MGVHLVHPVQPRALCYHSTLYASAAQRHHKGVSVSVLNIILLVVWAISAVGTVLFVLMHSGKGTGVSEMIAASMSNASAGSGVWEKNLDRLTIIFASLFGICCLVFMLTFPLATLNG